jgi:eukaryotic-like serine/threonine-protein kinase
MQNSPARSGIDVGSVIADTYTIEALIGRGGMGAVFLASHRRLPGKQVAIKVLHAELSGDEVLARFKREAEITSRLGHPNIVQVHDFNVMPDGTPYLVLEYMHGESLAQRLKAGPIPLDQALSIVRQIGSALAAAHREGIVHRDLKPQNIFLVPTEVDGRVVEIAKVLDFGISKIRGSTTVKTQDSALLGTPQYMAPEQATGQHKHVDERTDVFAFGAIVYEMLSGQPAFSGETIPEVVFKVVYEQPAQLAHQPEAITTAVHRALSKAQDDRFATVGQMVEALTGQPLPPARTGTSIPPPDVGFASGSRTPNTGKDAFAATMGSGDHAPAKVAADAQVGRDVAGRDLLVGNAPTVDSVRLGNAGTVSAHPAPAGKRKTVLIAAVLGVAAMAAVAILIMRDRTPPAPMVVDQPRVVAVDAAVALVPAIDAAVKAADVPAPPPGDDKPPDMPAPPPTKDKPPVVKATDKPPVVKATDKPDDDANDDDTDATGKKLKEAKTALDSSQADRAEQLARMVMTSEDSTPRQKARATMLYGMVQCIARNDESRARATLRKLAAAPKLRRQLLDVCHQHGWLQNVR